MQEEAEMQGFKDFLLDEMKKRHMSARAFAHWLGITHTTINRLLDPKDNNPPSLSSLVLIGTKTNTPIDHLISLIYPEVDDTLLRFDADVISLVQQIVELPADKREIAEAFILGLVLKNQDKTP